MLFNLLINNGLKTLKVKIGCWLWWKQNVC